MNIYTHELKMHTKSILTWSLSISVLILVFMSLFGAMADSAALLNEALSKFPKELLMAFGLTDAVDMATVLGYYGFILVFCQICVAIQAANYGFSLVSVEEREMTADFLVAKPVGRTRILTSKLLAAITGLVITALAASFSTVVFINVFREGRPYDAKTLLLMLLTLLILQIVFLTLGTLISLLVKRVRNVTPFSLGLAFGMYVLSTFGGLLGDAKLENITPFKQFDPLYIATHAGYDLPLALISVAFIVISVAGSYLLYTRRNIHTAV